MLFAWPLDWAVGRAEHIQYVTAAAGYPYLGWLMQRPQQFQVIATSPDGSKVFKVIS